MPGTTPLGIQYPYASDPFQPHVDIQAAATGADALLAAMTSQWVAYTPTWTAVTTSPTLGNGSLVGAYKQIGKTVHFRITVTAGSTTTFGAGAYILSLPVASATSVDVMLASVYALNQGVGGFAGICIMAGSTGITVRLPTSSSSNVMTTWAPTVPWMLKNTDIVSVYGTYQAA